MIKLKFDVLSKKLNKNILQIAEETGLNRNSLSALLHNKVDGIKFATLEKLCATYNLKLEEILEFVPPAPAPKRPKKIYRQEAEMVPFFSFPPAVSSSQYCYNFDGQRLKFSDLDYYTKNDYCFIYWNIEDLHKLADAFWKYYSESPSKFDNLYLAFQKDAREMERIYSEAEPKIINNLANKDLKNYTEKVVSASLDFWSHSLFIDAFDAGKDQEEINKIKEKYNLSLEEVSVLTTPVQMTFTNERQLAIYKIAELALEKKIAAKSKKAVTNFLKTEVQVGQYKKMFDYYASNYAVIKHITDKEIAEEIKNCLKDRKKFKQDLSRLSNYEKTQEARVMEIVARHNLRGSPLWFFSKLTYWREYRKKINLMSIHIFDMILGSTESKTGIPKKYLKYLTTEELGNVLDGLVDLEALKKRFDNGVLFSFREENEYRMFVGKEADSLKNELEKIIASEIKDSIISGQVASQGYAKGIARIVLSVGDFNKLKDGEVLVTGMTRPEFLPVMKKAAAIVTNEGGITCHAAIVSRELGKPCIIGTKNATELIKDGDLVEVRAHHGTVRILRS
jgi:phosphohistidine swiveling domain-containing protein/DNA-binding Xre family transcriptional regulator